MPVNSYVINTVRDACFEKLGFVCLQLRIQLGYIRLCGNMWFVIDCEQVVSISGTTATDP